MIDSLRSRATAAAQSWRPGCAVTEVSPLTGGSSSLTFVASVSGVDESVARLVLKVAPPGLPPVRNRDVLRQSRLLQVLHGQPGVVVPPVYFDDAGDPPFMAMGFVAGECVEPILEPSRDPAGFPQTRARALDASRVLAALHRVDPSLVSGEPVVTLADEISRWTNAFATVPEDLQGSYERCASSLHASVPAPVPPVVNHGDYRLGNTLCDGSRVTAVIDWEIWSIGDPRVDLTWMTFFTDEATHPAASGTGPSGMPTAAELLDAYGWAGRSRVVRRAHPLQGGGRDRAAHQAGPQERRPGARLRPDGAGDPRARGRGGGDLARRLRFSAHWGCERVIGPANVANVCLRR